MIGEYQRILVDFKAMTEDGEVFDSSEISGPLDITTNTHQVIKGVDEALMDMEVGETRTVVIPPEKAFGNYDERNVQKRELRYIPNADQLPVGQRIAFMGPVGQKISALVQKIEDGYAYLDFNNKLAGKTLTYELTVKELLPKKTRRTPISDYRGMARTGETHPVEETPVFNNFLQNLGITPEDIDKRYEEMQKEHKSDSGKSSTNAEVFVDKGEDAEQAD